MKKYGIVTMDMMEMRMCSMRMLCHADFPMRFLSQP